MTLNAQGMYKRVKSTQLQLEENSRINLNIERPNQVQLLSRHLITQCSCGEYIAATSSSKAYGCKTSALTIDTL